MAESKRDRKAELEALTAEELEQRLREAFFYPDKIDDTVFSELEALREALEEKRPTEAGYTAEESWARFLEDRADELEGILGPETRPAGGRAAAQPRVRRLPSLLRRTLIAAVIVVLLAGAALAAGPRIRIWGRSTPPTCRRATSLRKSSSARIPCSSASCIPGGTGSSPSRSPPSPPRRERSIPRRTAARRNTGWGISPTTSSPTPAWVPSPRCGIRSTILSPSAATSPLGR